MIKIYQLLLCVLMGIWFINGTNGNVHWGEATVGMKKSDKRFLRNLPCSVTRAVNVDDHFVRRREYYFECQNVQGPITFVNIRCDVKCHNPLTHMLLDSDLYRVETNKQILTFLTMEEESRNVIVTSKCSCVSKRNVKIKNVTSVQCNNIDNIQAV